MPTFAATSTITADSYPAVHSSRRHVPAFTLVAAVVLLAAALVLGRLGGGPLSASPPVPPGQAIPVGHHSYVVEPGDTLWSIARALAPAGGDIRPVVARLAAARGTAALRPGEAVVLTP